MTALDAQVLDVGAGGLRYPQPVDGQQGDQGVLSGGTEPGGDKERPDLVSVQGGGVRLVIQPRPPDVRGRRMVEKFPFDGVPAEPRDRGQAAGDGCPGAAAGFEFSGEVSMSARRTENSGRDRARYQPVNWRRSRV